MAVLSFNFFGLLCSLLALSSCDFLTKTIKDESGRPGGVLPVLKVSDIGDDYPYLLNIGLFRWTASESDIGFSDQDSCLEYEGRFSDSNFNASFSTAQYCSLLAPLFSTIALLLIYLDTCMVSIPCPLRLNYISGILYFLSFFHQSLTFLVLGEDRLCHGNCQLSGGAGASMAAMSSYFLALVIACAGIKGEVQPICGILWDKIIGREPGGNEDENDDENEEDDTDHDDRKEQPKEEALPEETDQKSGVSGVDAAAATPPIEDKKENTPVVDIAADLADMEEGLSMAEAKDAERLAETTHSPTASSASSQPSEPQQSRSQPQPATSSTTTSPSPREVPDTSKELAVVVEDDNVESSSEMALLSSPFKYLDQICCGSPTAAATTTTLTGLQK